MAFCTVCGTKIGDDSRFCGKCGQEILSEGKEGQVEECVSPLVQTETKPPLLSIALATVGMVMAVDSLFNYLLSLVKFPYQDNIFLSILLFLVQVVGYVFIVLGMYQYRKHKQLLPAIGLFSLSLYTLMRMLWNSIAFGIDFSIFVELMLVCIYAACGVGFLINKKIGNILIKIGGLSIIAGETMLLSVDIIKQVIAYRFEPYYTVFSIRTFVPILLGVAILLYPSKKKA